MFDKMTWFWGRSPKWHHCDICDMSQCHVTPNYAKVSIKVWIFFGQSFIDVGLGVPEILRIHLGYPQGYISQKAYGE